jgi:hypothetical protein
MYSKLIAGILCVFYASLAVHAATVGRTWSLLLAAFTALCWFWLMVR